MIGTANGCWFAFDRRVGDWVQYEFFHGNILCLTGFCREDDLAFRFEAFDRRMTFVGYGRS